MIHLQTDLQRALLRKRVTEDFPQQQWLCGRTLKTETEHNPIHRPAPRVAPSGFRLRAVEQKFSFASADRDQRKEQRSLCRILLGRTLPSPTLPAQT